MTGTDDLTAALERAEDLQRRCEHEVADVAVCLYRILCQIRREFPFPVLSAQDNEDLVRTGGVLWEQGLLDVFDLDPPEWLDAELLPTVRGGQP